MPWLADTKGIRIAMVLSVLGTAISYAVQGSAHHFMPLGAKAILGGYGARAGLQSGPDTKTALCSHVFDWDLMTRYGWFSFLLGTRLLDMLNKLEQKQFSVLAGLQPPGNALALGHVSQSSRTLGGGCVDHDGWKGHLRILQRQHAHEPRMI